MEYQRRIIAQQQAEQKQQMQPTQPSNVQAPVEQDARLQGAILKKTPSMTSADLQNQVEENEAEQVESEAPVTTRQRRGAKPASNIASNRLGNNTRERRANQSSKPGKSLESVEAEKGSAKVEQS